MWDEKMKDVRSSAVKRRKSPVSSLRVEQSFNNTCNMMRIAIAGTGGLARTLAYHLNETVHQFILLSRAVCSPLLICLFANMANLSG